MATQQYSEYIINANATTYLNSHKPMKTLTEWELSLMAKRRRRAQLKAIKEAIAPFIICGIFMLIVYLLFTWVGSNPN